MFADGRNVQTDVQTGEEDAVPVADGGRRGAVAAVRPWYGVLCSAAQMLLGNALRLEASEERVSLLMPRSGNVAVDGVPAGSRLSKGQALLIGHAVSLEPVRGDPALLLRIDIPRIAIQAEAFAQTDIPRRFGRTNILLDHGDFGADLAEVPGADARTIISGLVKELVARSDRDGFFPVAGSVRRALDRLAVIGDEPVSLDDVVKASGVVHDTLRRAVKEVTGVPLGRLMQNARLDWYRTRLRDDCESRSLRELAAAVGYHPAVCSRAYQLRFGQTPTQTRAEAFANVR